MNTLFNWGIREHLLQLNPAVPLKSIGRPEDRRTQLRVDRRRMPNHLGRGGGGLKIALALGILCGFAHQDHSETVGAPATALQSSTAGGGLRHTAAKRLADLGADPRRIAEVLGHKSLVAVVQYLEEAERKRRAEAGMKVMERT
jgi:hypothetical protein